VAVEIDISDVPHEKRDDLKFVELLRQMQAAVNNRKWQTAFSVHEAGHKVYLSRLGITEFAFIGPKITYDKHRDDFDGYPAAVKAEPVPLRAEGFDIDNWLLQLAQSKAAGSVFSRSLTAVPDSGDTEDRHEFSYACNLVREKLPEHPIDEERIWNEAQEAVKRDLRSPSFRRKCWQEANEVRQKLFGP
jgi:hypothetical protein